MGLLARGRCGDGDGDGAGCCGCGCGLMRRFVSLCCSVADALVDVSYNLSTTTLKPLETMHGVVDNIRDRNWTQAAEALNATKWCGLSVAACADDVANIANGCP